MPGFLLSIHKWVRPSKGQSIVEFAIVMPLLLLLVGGIIDFGYVLYQKITITQMATTVARSSAIQVSTLAAETDATIIGAARTSQPVAWDTKAKIEYATGTRVPSEQLTVTITCKPQPLTGLSQAIFPEQLTSIVRARVER